MIDITASLKGQVDNVHNSRNPMIKKKTGFTALRGSLTWFVHDGDNECLELHHNYATRRCGNGRVRL